MRNKRKEIFRLLLADFSIFIMSVFVVSDLINLHLRLIYHVDLYATQTVVSGKVSKSKDDKTKVKVLSFFFAASQSVNIQKNIYPFVSDFVFISESFISLSSASVLSRAPPSLI